MSSDKPDRAEELAREIRYDPNLRASADKIRALVHDAIEEAHVGIEEEYARQRAAGRREALERAIGIVMYNWHRRPRHPVLEALRAELEEADG